MMGIALDMRRRAGPRLVGDAPLAVYASPGAQPNAVGLTLPAMRAETAAAVARLQAHGDRRVHYVDGWRLYGPEHRHLSPDGVHPTAAGQDVLAGAFLREVVTPYFT
jgi:lysophospholipase L1-like esterase